ncbi:MAG TPA: DNA polymerase V [Gammaproteobacteria bacterium]|nr:DNA polymerase V [Gammaproteobacteria bacterium]MEC8011257.1 translesion error-prone DNA polymerase V autoproteolytic subunit [Pseudomonadota bacterium]HBF07371.1 DNA polymerase V [Gammaproteobacteria bacterium]HCK92247.1 DNA polymerase V [Gammaproteobacteria bacterium]|tara:strand:- start:317 stop:910 length:594 start_codon:yes stop_codon:yes gene_type:complete
MKKETPNKRTHGGARAGAGRKKQLGFGEETKPMRVPISLIPMVKEMLEVRKETLAQLSQAMLKPAEELPAMERPLFSSNVSAGFPSPADDYIEGQLDLNELMILRPSATFYVRVTGESMKNAGILPDDILVVDRSKTVNNNAIVIAVVDNELTVKRFSRQGNSIQLIPENPDFPVITLNNDMELSIWGVVTGVVRKF